MESAAAKAGKKGIAPICSQNPPGRPGKWGLSPFFPNRGWHLVRIAVAGLLLTASSLKCWQLATEPVIGTGLLDSRWLLIATVEFEFFLATLLLANLWAKPTWATALACFGLFTCISVCKALSGYTTCGCFGRLMISPWYTSGLDFAVMASLLHWRPKESFFVTNRAAAVVVIWLAIGLPAAVAMANYSYSPTILSDTGDIIGDGKMVVLEPEKWIGKRFPLLDYIDIGQKLKEGKWIVLLYHHDCPDCQEMIRGLCEPSQNYIAWRLALIELSPYGKPPVAPADAGRGRPAALGKLQTARDWFLRTPAILMIVDGTVTKNAFAVPEG